MSRADFVVIMCLSFKHITKVVNYFDNTKLFRNIFSQTFDFNIYWEKYGTKPVKRLFAKFNYIVLRLYVYFVITLENIR